MDYFFPFKIIHAAKKLYKFSYIFLWRILDNQKIS